LIVTAAWAATVKEAEAQRAIIFLSITGLISQDSGERIRI
jgi:hypothetical protein